jgi:hypothetical protein
LSFSSRLPTHFILQPKYHGIKIQQPYTSKSPFSYVIQVD